MHVSCVYYSGRWTRFNNIIDYLLYRPTQNLLYIYRWGKSQANTTKK